MQDSDVKEFFSAMKMLNDKVEKMEKEYLARIEELEKQVKELKENKTKTGKEFGWIMSPEEFEAYKKKLQKESPMEFEKLNNMLQPSNKLSEKRPSEVKNNKVSDPYSKENFIDRGDYYELVIPIGSIHAIEKRIKKERPYKMAKNYASQCRIGEFSDWRLPTIDELEVLCDKCPRIMRSIVGSVYSIAKILSSSSYCVWYQGSYFSIQNVSDYSSYCVFCVR